MPNLTSALAELVKQLKEVQRLALSDDLTPLGNRAAMKKVRSEVEPQGKYTVIFVDLTGFKRINDDHGHEVGDAAIFVIGQWLREISEQLPCYAFRPSGDEFILFVKDVNLNECCARLRGELPQLEVEGGKIAVNITFGFTALEGDPDLAVEKAEEACVYGKSTGECLVEWRPNLPKQEERRWRCDDCNASVFVKATSLPKPLTCPSCGTSM